MIMMMLMKSVADEGEISRKIIACVHDNANNIVLANSSQFVPWKSSPCSAHTL